MGKPRQSHKHLPPRVYWKNNRYRLLTREGKWITLGKTLADSMMRYGELIENPLDNRTMHAVFDRYYKEISPTKSPRTYKAELYSLKALRSGFGDMEPAEITPVEVYKFMDIRKRTSVFQANKERSLLSSVLNSAIRWGLVNDNVCRNVKPLPEPEGRGRYVTDEEFQALYTFAGEYNPTTQAIMMIAYLTALRLADLLKIKLSDLKEEGIEIKTNKTNKGFIIGWTDELIQAVNNAKQLKGTIASMYLFSTRRGKPYREDGFKSMWQRLMRAALRIRKDKDGNPKEPVLKKRFMFKDLRAKAASDIDLELARQLLGHTTSRTTQRHYRKKLEKVMPAK